MRDPMKILNDTLRFKGIQTSQVLEAYESYLSLWFLNFIEPCDISQLSRTQCIQIFDIMKYNLTLFWGSLMFLLFALS